MLSSSRRDGHSSVSLLAVKKKSSGCSEILFAHVDVIGAQNLNKIIDAVAYENVGQNPASTDKPDDYEDLSPQLPERFLP
jgi:hypothetical protein